MKKKKTLLVVFGVLFQLAALIDYVGQVTSCYPSAEAWKNFTDLEKIAVERTCRLTASPTSRFTIVLALLIIGLVLFSAYWLSLKFRVKIQRGGLLSCLLILMMVACVLACMYGLVSFPVPMDVIALPIWVVESTACLGYLGYIGALAIWCWKRWGVFLFQVSTILLAAVFAIGTGLMIPAGILILGVLCVTMLVRPIRSGLV